MSRVSANTTTERFNDWARELNQRHSVPMLMICVGIKPGHAIYGRMFAINSQGKTAQDMIDLMRATADQMEADMQ